MYHWICVVLKLDGSVLCCLEFHEYISCEYSLRCYLFLNGEHIDCLFCYHPTMGCAWDLCICFGRWVPDTVCSIGFVEYDLFRSPYALCRIDYVVLLFCDQWYLSGGVVPCCVLMDSGGSFEHSFGHQVPRFYNCWCISDLWNGEVWSVNPHPLLLRLHPLKLLRRQC